MICKYCNSNIDNHFNHIDICIYYIYNTNYSNHLSNAEIEDIVTITNLFNLYKYSNNKIFSIDTIINTLIIKSELDNSISNNIIVNLINSVSNFSNIITYNTLVAFICESYNLINTKKIKIEDVQNVVSAYKICYSNLEMY